MYYDFQFQRDLTNSSYGRGLSHVGDHVVSLRTEKVMLVDMYYIFEVQCACQLDNVITYLE